VRSMFRPSSQTALDGATTNVGPRGGLVLHVVRGWLALEAQGSHPQEVDGAPTPRKEERQAAGVLGSQSIT
jgi:hypothetical protein